MGEYYQVLYLKALCHDFIHQIDFKIEFFFYNRRQTSNN